MGYLQDPEGLLTHLNVPTPEFSGPVSCTTASESVALKERFACFASGGATLNFEGTNAVKVWLKAKATSLTMKAMKASRSSRPTRRRVLNLPSRWSRRHVMAVMCFKRVWGGHESIRWVYKIYKDLYSLTSSIVDFGWNKSHEAHIMSWYIDILYMYYICILCK